jgi:hypothetical protein
MKGLVSIDLAEYGVMVGLDSYSFDTPITGNFPLAFRMMTGLVFRVDAPGDFWAHWYIPFQFGVGISFNPFPISAADNGWHVQMEGK